MGAEGGRGTHVGVKNKRQMRQLQGMPHFKISQYLSCLTILHHEKRTPPPQSQITFMPLPLTTIILILNS